MHARLLGLAVGTLVALGAASSLAAQAPEGATAKCKDDSYSTSASHRGACKGHGGVAEWLSTAKTAKTKSSKTGKAEAKAGVTETTAKSKTKSKKEKTTAASETAAPAEAAAPAAPAAPAHAATAAKSAPSGAAPGDATAQCKDGSYSRAHHHRGACSRHGGVQQWLKEVPE